MTPETPDADDVVLDASADTAHEAFLDHPVGPTDAEADAGHAVYLAVDDTDDESNGLPA